MVHSDGDSTTLTRRELYDRVWATPGLKLAKEFGISDVGLAKVCKRHRIPRPPRGYWAKLEVGKPVRRTPLPKLSDEQLETVRVSRQRPLTEVASNDRESRPAVVVAETLESPHPLVQQTLRVLRTAKAGHDKVLRPDEVPRLDIRVSRTSLDRALRIFDAFIKSWESLEGTVPIALHQYKRTHQTFAALHGDQTEVELFEEIERVQTRPDDTRNLRFRDFTYQPTGRLIFKMSDHAYGRRTRWGDGKRQRLETVLTAIVDALLADLEAKRGYRLDEECVARQKETVKRVRHQAAERKAFEERRRSNLLERVKGWRQAAEIRAFLGELRRKRESGAVEVTDEPAFAEWDEWATWYADRIDPLVATPPHPVRREAPRNLPIADLEFTRRTRQVVAKLGAQTAEQLHRVERESLNGLIDRWYSSEWDEICRVLEGLGYDVEGRYRDGSI